VADDNNNGSASAALTETPPVAPPHKRFKLLCQDIRQTYAAQRSRETTGAGCSAETEIAEYVTAISQMTDLNDDTVGNGAVSFLCHFG
jgi:hypothetical protein